MSRHVFWISSSKNNLKIQLLLKGKPNSANQKEERRMARNLRTQEITHQLFPWVFY
jgi:hypothetical protein